MTPPIGRSRSADGKYSKYGFSMLARLWDKTIAKPPFSEKVSRGVLEKPLKFRNYFQTNDDRGVIGARNSIWRFEGQPNGLIGIFTVSRYSYKLFLFIYFLMRMDERRHKEKRRKQLTEMIKTGDRQATNTTFQKWKRKWK